MYMYQPWQHISFVLLPIHNSKVFKTVPPFSVALRREGYVQASAIHFQLIMQILNMLVSFSNRPNKRPVREFYGVEIWIQGMRGNATLIVYDSYVHFFIRNEHVALVLKLYRWIVHDGKGYHAKAF